MTSDKLFRSIRSTLIVALSTFSVPTFAGHAVEVISEGDRNNPGPSNLEDLFTKVKTIHEYYIVNGPMEGSLPERERKRNKEVKSAFAAARAKRQSEYYDYRRSAAVRFKTSCSSGHNCRETGSYSFPSKLAIVAGGVSVRASSSGLKGWQIQDGGTIYVTVNRAGGGSNATIIDLLAYYPPGTVGTIVENELESLRIRLNAAGYPTDRTPDPSP